MKNVQKLIFKFKELKTIESQLPIKFQSGVRFDSLAAHCNSCDEVINSENFRGSIITLNADDNESFMMSYGYCEKCDFYTAYNYTLSGKNGDLTMAGLKKGQYTIFKSTPFDYFQKYRDML